MRTAIRRILFTLVAVAATTNCDPATAVALPAIIITNTWDVVGQDGRSFSFASAEDGEVHGTFTGSENLPDGSEVPLTGAWASGEVRFTVQGAPHSTTYQGTFTDLTNRFTVASPGETITLQRQGT